MKDNIFGLILHLFKCINSKRQRQYYYLLFLTLLASIAEVLSLSAIIPFITVITDPDILNGNQFIEFCKNFFILKDDSDLTIFLSIAFGITALVAGLFRLIVLKYSIFITMNTGVDISNMMYTKILYQPYSYHVARSTSEIISGITQKVSAVTASFTSFATIITNSILFISILITLLVVSPSASVIAFGVFGFLYLLIGFSTEIRLKRNSRLIASNQTFMVKSLQEGLGSIRDVILDGAQDYYSKIYSKSVETLFNANGQNKFINQSPRYLMETLGLTLISLLVVMVILRGTNIIEALPIFALFALAAQRMLPLMQQIFGNWSVMKGSTAGLIDVIDILDLQDSLPRNQNNKKRTFSKELVLNNIYFKYPGEKKNNLSSLNLKIYKGDVIGFIGETGSGKSTTLDIIMGLLEPDSGSLILDGNEISQDEIYSYQQIISHVPQAIFLADSSFNENIAFGVPKNQIDLKRVRHAAKAALLEEFILSKPHKFETHVGERGAKLSGGQRQRLGIARALYKKSQILILDEATSALDNKTESEIISSIVSFNENLTIIMVAHRLSTLSTCKKIYKLESGRIIDELKYEDLYEK